MSSTNYDPTDYQLFINNGAGIPYMIGISGNGVISTQVSGTGAIQTVLMSGSMTGTLPISVTNNNVSITTASTSTSGSLTSTDWNTFNNKQPAGTYNTTIATSGLGVSLINTGGPAVTQILNSISGLGTVTLSGPTNGVISISGSAGDVVGPASATNYGVATFNGITGKLIRDTSTILASGSVLNIGTTNVTTGAIGLVVGTGNTIDNTRAYAFGSNNRAMGQDSMAVGQTTTASGMGAFAEGAVTLAFGNYSHAEGGITRAMNYCSHAEGLSTSTSGNQAHAEGELTFAIGTNSHAQGSGSVAFANMSHAEGLSTTAYGNNSHAEGSNTIASGQSSHAEGSNNFAYGDFSHAGGSGTTVNGIGSFSHGGTITVNGLYAFGTGFNNLAPAAYSFTVGSGNLANGIASVSEGQGTTANGQSSHAEGNLSVAQGITSHAEGFSTRAEGAYSHSEGASSKAYAQASHAEGDTTIASGTSSHSEGGNTITYGLYSHAEGNASMASGNTSHAEGNSTKSLGVSSHAQGDTTIAGGLNSFAGGFTTQALGVGSVALGYNAIASASGSWIFADTVGASQTNSTANSLAMRFAGGVALSGTVLTTNSDISGNNIYGVYNQVNGRPIPFQSPRQQTQYTPLAAATVQGIGAPLATITATLSQPAWSNAFGWSQNIATSTVVNNNAGFIGVAQFAYISGTQSATNQPVNNGIEFRTRFCTPDASYAGANGCRILIGLTSQGTPATAVASDNPAGNYMALQYCTASGSARQDTVFRLFTKDSTTQATGSMTLAPIQNCIYDFYMSLPNTAQGASPTITWRLDNITSGTSAQGTTTANIPLSNTALLPMMHILTAPSGAGVARNLKWTSMNIAATV